MISPLPWSLNEGNPSIIYDADGNTVAEDYKFLHVDDFESICKLVNKDYKKAKKDAERRFSEGLDNLQQMGCY